MKGPIKILIVDDSASIRNLLTQLLGEYPDIQVIGTAEDPIDAREKIKQLNPDVITLDVEMPKMDGISFLEKIMALRPMPVVMVSTLTGRGTDTAIAALQRGAIECIAKPAVHSNEELAVFSFELAAKIRIASAARIMPRKPPAERSPHRLMRTQKSKAPKLIAIGASTGGVEALTEVLTNLPKEIPPVVITQHMPPLFTASFANRLSTLCEITVCEAAHHMQLKNGTAYIAPGGKQCEVIRVSSGFSIRISDGPTVNNHKPSVDVLFDSVATHAGAEALGVILTGMGADGAKGLLKMRESGAHTIGQDEASCTVYGMPRAAHELGAVIQTASLTHIAETINTRCFS